MNKIILPITIIAIVCFAFTGCAHGIAKGNSDADTIDTVLVDTVEADSVIDDEEFGDIRYYEDKYLTFQYPSEYQCVQASNGAIVLFGDSLMHNSIVFDYGELHKNENAESAVKLMTVNTLQNEKNAELTFSKSIPVPPDNELVKEQYLAMIKVNDEQEPALLWITGVILKNGHFHVSTARATNEHDSNMFQAILKTVVMR